MAGTAGEKVNGIFIDTCNAAGLDPCPGKSQEKWVRDAGFEDVHTTSMIMPFGTWPADKTLVSPPRAPPFAPCSRRPAVL